MYSLLSHSVLFLAHWYSYFSIIWTCNYAGYSVPTSPDNQGLTVVSILLSMSVINNLNVFVCMYGHLRQHKDVSASFITFYVLNYLFLFFIKLYSHTICLINNLVCIKKKNKCLSWTSMEECNKNNPFQPKEWQTSTTVISPYNITPESHTRVTRIEEMITN